MRIKNTIFMKAWIIAACFQMLTGAENVKAQPYELKSPDGLISISLDVISGSGNSDAGQLVYWVDYRGKSLIEQSELGLELENQKPLGESVRIVDKETSAVDQSYKLIAGKTSSVRDQYNALNIDLQEEGDPARKFTLEARAYNDAIAFRYVLPEQPNVKEFRLKGENTEFKISKDAFTYAQILPNFRHSYESEYIKLPIASFSHQGSVVNDALIGLPLLMEVPGVAWLAVNEADMHDYTKMYITNLSRSWEGHWLKAVLAPQFEDTGIYVTGSMPHHSPWRILQIANEPGKLLESNILTSLNPETKLKETSWIKPGKSSWNWWSGSIGPDGKPAFTTDVMKYYVDFSAKSGFDYMLIDAGWSAKGDITKMNGKVDIPEVVEYANAKNVKVWIWLHYDDVIRQIEEAFPVYEQWGVAGLKIDFIERDDQEGTDFYYRVAEQAARHHLMLDFHGSTIPTGLSRTYPNILGYEAVAGMEVSHGSLRDNPDSHVMIAFTRMLQGFMDYTPGGFNNVTKEEFEPRNVKTMVMGTRAHHLSMYVVYEAPLQMVSDHPAAYADQPSFQFIKDVPATWDETKVLNGVPGEYITIGRRNGDEWFVGSMTNWTPRQLKVSLDFLDEGPYRAEIYKDAPDSDRHPKKCIVEEETVTNDQQLEINLVSAGGYAVRFIPIEQQVKK